MAVTGLHSLHILGCYMFRNNTLVQSVQILFHRLQEEVLIQWDCRAKEIKTLDVIGTLFND